MACFHVKNNEIYPHHDQLEIKNLSTSKSSLLPPSKQENKMKQIKQFLIDWNDHSTWAGLNNMFRTQSKTVFTVWFIFYLASITYCIYNCVNLTLAFFSYNVLINMEFKTEIPTTFPAVTICNLNPIDRRKGSDYIDRILISNNLEYVHNTFLININPDMILNLVKSSLISNDSHQANLGFTLDYMLLNCQFNGYSCNQSDFITTYNYDYGNCFTFNSGYDSSGSQIPIKQISEAGSDKSFKIELFLGDEFVQSKFVLNSGARVIVHNQSVTPIFTSEGRDVASGYLTNIGVTRSFFNKLNQPYSDCIMNTTDINSFGSNFYQAMFNVLKSKSYRQKNCLQLCLQEYLKNECECLDGSLPIIYNRTISVCTSLMKLECLNEKKSEYFKNHTLIEKCYEYCPLECDSNSFLYSSSISRYPSMYYVQYLKNRMNITQKILSLNQSTKYMNDNNFTKNIVLINVFYDDLLTTFIEEIPAIDGNFLIGNIGGYIGLFAGLTVLSFVEIIELVIEVFLIICGLSSTNK